MLWVITLSSLCISTEEEHSEGNNKNAWRAKYLKFVEETLESRLPDESNTHCLELALKCLSWSFTQDLRSCLPSQLWLEDETLVISLTCSFSSYNACQESSWFGICVFSAWKKNIGTTKHNEKLCFFQCNQTEAKLQTMKWGCAERKHNWEHETKQLVQDEVRLRSPSSLSVRTHRGLRTD